jgi:hypothetical protein
VCGRDADDRGTDDDRDDDHRDGALVPEAGDQGASRLRRCLGSRNDDRGRCDDGRARLADRSKTGSGDDHMDAMTQLGRNGESPGLAGRVTRGSMLQGSAYAF